MAAPHRIRLHGPWTVQSSPEGSIPRTVPMPGPIPPSPEAESNPDTGVILERAFGRPTNLGGADTVDLVVENLVPGAEIFLNGSTLEAPSGRLYRSGIRELLEARNLLRIVLSEPGPGTVPFGNLCLEITDGPPP